MKLKVPSLFQTFRQLPWFSGAVDALTFRRLYVRIFIATLLVILLGTVFAVPGMIIGWNVLTIIMAGAPGLLAMVTMFWLFGHGIKISVLRLRHLGVEENPYPFVVYLGAMIIGAVAAGFQAHMVANGGITQAQIMGLGLIPAAVVNGLLFFREKPVFPSKSKLLTPLGKDMKGEKIAQFLLETYMWFTILRTPLDIIFPS